MKHFESYSIKLQRRKRILVFVKYIIIIFFAYEIFVNYCIRTYRVETNSMSPNIQSGYHIVASSLVYGINAPFSYGKMITFSYPKRGDVVIILHNKKEPNIFNIVINAVIKFFTLQQCQIPTDSVPANGLLIRRIIGVPGDVMYMNNYLVYNKTQKSYHFLSEYEVSSEVYDLVLQNNELWPDNLPFSSKFDSITLGENQYFVLSDTRTKINDSRYWGVISVDDILAKVIAIYWPVQRMKKF